MTNRTTSRGTTPPSPADNRPSTTDSKQYDDLSLDEPELSGEEADTAAAQPESTDESTTREDGTVASETLAIINARQGNMAVTREMIQQLKLKNPEKSTYFDELLQRLEKSND